MAAESPPAPALPPSVAVFVADELEAQILDGQRLPGAPLQQLDLAAEFGVSRVPVRDALALLERRQLAVRLPRKGVIVRPVTPEGVRQVFAARRLLEAEIVRLAAGRIGAAALARLDGVVAAQRSAARAGDLAALRATDREFHAVIWRAGENEVLEELARTVWLRGLAARAVGHRLPGWGEKSIDRHLRIVHALRTGDAGVAAMAVLDAVASAEAEILVQLEGAAGAAEVGR
jgi:DNA-binding GntR family transcriptional regulator